MIVIYHFEAKNSKKIFGPNATSGECTRLYSDRTEHFCGRGPRNLMKLLEGVPYMEKIISSPSEPFLAIRVCQKCPKTKKHEKPGF